MQIKLSFVDDLPVPQTSVWDQVDDKQKTVVIETIARLIANMISAENHQEQKNDR
jgi:hypothetical protein